MPYELSKEAASRARKAFLQVLESAVPAYELGQLELFPNEDEAIIRREVERKLHKPRIPNAGETEREWVTKLKAMSFSDYWRNKECAAEFSSDGDEKKGLKWLCGRAAQAAAKWGELLPRDQYDRSAGYAKPNAGRYYFRHPLTPKTDKQGFQWFTELKRSAMETQEWEVKWFAQLMLDGLPESASDFSMEALCGLRRWNGDVLRIVRLRNVVGESLDFLELKADEFKSPEAYREWCLSQGNFHWNGNQTHLQDLHEDTGRHMAWRIVNEIDNMGWYALPTSDHLSPDECDGIWFYAKSAYYRGKMYRMDRDKIFWITVVTGRSGKGEEIFEEQGFYLAKTGRENSEFMQGRPDMRPDVNIADVLTFQDIEEWINKPEPRTMEEQKAEAEKKVEAGKRKPSELGVKFSERELLKAFFREICFRLSEWVGGAEGNLGIGAMLSYLAAPEIFARKKLFPGLFVHGQMQSGKGTLCEWLVALHGFFVSAGTGKPTAVGILQQAQNYGNLPVWVDEFRESEMHDLVPILRFGFNRQSSPKWVPPDGVHRKYRTMFLVSGETTCSDAATRSRFSHIQVSQAKRKESQQRGAGDHFEWFQRNKEHFYLLTRFVLEQRQEFVAAVFKYLESWQGFAELKTVGDRDKIAHGIHWASWMAMMELLESHDAREAGEFKRFMLDNTKSASREVVADTNVAMFFRDLLNCFKAGEIELDCFKVTQLEGQYPEGRRFPKVKLFIDPDATIASVAAYLRKQGERVSLRRNDLMAQMSKESYWLPGAHRRRFSTGSESTACWGWDLDEHPLGRQSVTEEMFKASLDEKQSQLSATIGEDFFIDGDPRKGPLYAIVHAVLEHEDQKRRAAREESQ